jgi:crotonobetainyl-CoA:carnitine CoA-transferase CaiB-like acyl-CoA transferase
MANHGFVEIAGPTGPGLRSVNGPVTFSDLPLRPAGPVPAIGEHTDEVLGDIT